MKDIRDRLQKKENRGGFTLAELLIVVAIIAVLVAIAIPIFNSQLNRSKDATSAANARSAYAEAMAAYLSADSSGTTTIGNATVNMTTKRITVTDVYLDIKSDDLSGQISELPFDDGGLLAKQKDKPGTYSLVFSVVNDKTELHYIEP